MKKRVYFLSISKLLVSTVFAVATPGVSWAESGVLRDVNGDGEVNVLAFGDSLTYGVGDGLESGAYVEVIEDSGKPRGYPQRVSAATGVSVSNAGVPGERVLMDGVIRFGSLVQDADVDTVVIMEGTNDAIQRVEGGEYAAGIQRMINVARAEGKGVLIATIAPPTGLRESLVPYTNLYSSVVRDLAVINSIPVADVEQKFLSTCPDLQTCSLYNLPEGLHPNTAGYDAIAEVIQSGLAGSGS